jgi:hypothetical protein
MDVIRRRNLNFYRMVSASAFYSGDLGLKSLP